MMLGLDKNFGRSGEIDAGGGIMDKSKNTRASGVNEQLCEKVAQTGNLNKPVNDLLEQTSKFFDSANPLKL